MILTMSVYQSLLQNYGSTIDKYLLLLGSVQGHVDLVSVLLLKGLDIYEPHQAFSHPFENALLLAARNKRKAVLDLFELHLKATPIGWFGEIDRNGSENLLKDCKVGTFLTRYSQNAQSYVISHVLPDKTIEHMAQIYPIENRRVKVENSKGVFFYTSFVEYIYEGAMSDEYMYCWCPLPSELQFSPKKSN